MLRWGQVPSLAFYILTLHLRVAGAKKNVFFACKPHKPLYNIHMTRKQRTPQEIIAETEAKLSRLRVKQAKQDELRKDIREARKGLGDGPQSFNARIAKHEAWIEKVEDLRADAEATLDHANGRKAQIEAELADVLNNLVSDTGTAELSANA